MSNSIYDNVKAFFEWYQQLYGGEFYIDETPEQVTDLPQVATDVKVDAKPEPAEGYTPLQAYRREIENCPKCSLCETRTNFVFGVGNESADIMFVGEAPGRDEDLQGLPFVGRAGKLLNQLIGKVGLKREDVYIANILKCRPPNNRDPLPAEVAECLPYLHRQIEMVKPKMLVALGRIAGQNLLGRADSLTKMRRKLWIYQNTPLIVTFHPAYILRNANMMDEAVAEMQMVVTEYQKLLAE
ncbi:MAG: uracil-DNA glycosylase [Calditrichia bacterium]